jgi:hypothetical protein
MGTPFEDGTEGETRRGKMMADIAKERKIEHLVYSSVANADKNTGIPHFESKYKIEQHIMENLLGPGLQQGQLALPLSPSSILQQSAIENNKSYVSLHLVVAYNVDIAKTI